MFETEFARTEYIAADNAVLHVWKKEAHLEDYRAPVAASLDLLREHPGSIFIVDARNGFEDVKEDVEWGFEFFLPELKKTGCKIWGFILPKVSHIEGEIDLWTKEIEKNFRVIRAVSYEEILSQSQGDAELWDLYDRDGNRTGEVFRRGFGNFRDIPEGRYHLGVDILVRHIDGTYLLTRRSEDKDVYPGYWEASAGGSAVSGEEPLEAAERELAEETGLTADRMELVGVLFKDSSRAMFYTYVAYVSCDKDSVKLQEGETTAYKWVDREAYLRHMDSDEAIASQRARYSSYIGRIRKE